MHCEINIIFKYSNSAVIESVKCELCHYYFYRRVHHLISENKFLQSFTPASRIMTHIAVLSLPEQSLKQMCLKRSFYADATRV